MKILHPNNKEHSTLKELSDYYANGFYSIISDDEKEKLNYFLNAFQEFSPQVRFNLLSKYPAKPVMIIFVFILTVYNKRHGRVNKVG